MPFRNVHACLVHEDRECVIDLVKNLHHLDPASTILLYNGGPDPHLCGGHFPFERWGAVVHPAPRRMHWGKLHDFALDCMRYALASIPFDAMTIVDSDQLAARPGYSEYLAAYLASRPRAGLLGNAPGKQGPIDRAPPAITALREIELWRPFLRRFPGAEDAFVHWTFWPSTVITAAAARDLVALFDDPQLQTILRRSRMWATEEVLFPTLTALLGHEVLASPCSYDYVKYRVPYAIADLDAAFADPRVHWFHPIPRRRDDPLRRHVRAHYGEYGDPAPPPAPRRALQARAVVAEVRSIEGWLSDAEAHLLVDVAARALAAPAEPLPIVEIGSYCGKATVALARVAEAIRPEVRVFAVDPHDGVVGARDTGLHRTPPTRARFDRTIARAGLARQVITRESRAPEVTWEGPIGILLVDGLHDYGSVRADFGHFERWIPPGGLAAFHDYASYFPGVVRFVDELAGGGAWEQIGRADSLVVLRRRDPVRAVVAAEPPLVSAIMPTADRRRFVPLAIRHFLQQDYARRELVVVDDGADPVADLIPADPRIRYLRLPARRPIGWKRNHACREARGDIIVHWDDDDWMAPRRIRYQVDRLLAEDAALAGLNRVLYHQPASGQSWQYVYSGERRWFAGNTLCYRKAFWEKNPFPQIDVGEDARFVWNDRQSRMATLADETFFVGMVHGGNVSPKRTDHAPWRPLETERIRAVMGEDFDTYRALFAAPMAG